MLCIVAKLLQFRRDNCHDQLNVVILPGILKNLSREFRMCEINEKMTAYVAQSMIM